MNVHLWNFSKRVNSTRQPPTTGYVIDCSMRTGLGGQTCQIEYRGSVGGLQYNYAYIPDIGKYYYITDQTYNAEENYILLNLDCDVLATYRTQIFQSQQQVLRWSGSTDNSIVDNLICTQSEPYIRTQNITRPFDITSSFSNSCVVLNLAGSGRLCMTGSNYNKLMNNFTRKTDPLNVGDYFTTDVARLLTNPLSYIESAMCLPLAAYGGSTGTPVMAQGSGFAPIFGWYTVPDVTAFWCQSNILHLSDSVGVSGHPDATSVNDFLNYPPFTDVKIYVAGIGIIGLDTNRITGAENLRIQTEIDMTTGVIIIRVKKESSNHVIGYATGQLGYSLSTAQAHSADMIGLAGNALMGSVIGGISGGVGGALLGGVGNVGSNLGNNAGLTVHGSTGGAGAWSDVNGQFITVMETYKRVRKPAKDLHGAPYNSYATLANLGGYVQCLGGDVACTGTETQKLKIKNYLQGGVFLE